MSEKTYTAQELRQTAEMDFYVTKLGLDDGPNLTDEIRSMLRQAADAEDELAKLSESKNRWMQYQETAAGERNACIDELRKKDAEIMQLKARLEAVKYACEQAKKLVSQISMPMKRENGLCSTDHMIATGLNMIICAARGEAAGESEVK